jgi:hypothetical protein
MRPRVLNPMLLCPPKKERNQREKYKSLMNLSLNFKIEQFMAADLITPTHPFCFS